MVGSSVTIVGPADKPNVVTAADVIFIGNYISNNSSLELRDFFSY